MSDYTLTNLDDVPDSAKQFGFSDTGEARFGRESVGAEDTGFAFHRLKPGKRQSFGHVHQNAEEIAVVLEGAGRMKVGDEIVDLKKLDVMRLGPTVPRAFEAGPDGLELLVFGPHTPKDGELLQDFWPAED